MIEIRAVRSEELDQMLAVMCEAFSLPFAPARELFYRDPYFDIEKKRVLVEDDLVISCLTIVDATMWVGAAPVQIAGIAGVATRTNYRGRHYASRLLEGTISALHTQGYALSALFPYSYTFYRRYGWERAGTQYRATIPPAALPSFAESRYVRAALPSDRAALQQLYDTHRQHRTGCCLRDEKRWRYLFDHAKSKVVFKRGDHEGYALYEIREDADGRRTLRLLEALAISDGARRGLIGYLAQQNQVAEIEYIASWEGLYESGLIGPGTFSDPAVGPVIEAMPGVMFRVIDLQRALETLRPNFAGFTGQATLVIRDEYKPPDAPDAVTIEGDGAQVEVRPASPTSNPRRRIEGDVRTWSAVMVGYYSLQDAISLRLLRAYSDSVAALAAPLFPRRAPFIPAPDHF